MTNHVLEKVGSSQLTYKLLIVIATIIWGSSFFIMKNTTDVLPVSLLLFIRFIIASMVLAAIFARRLKLHHDLGHVWRGCLLGILLFMGYWFQTVGITDTTPGKNAFLTAAYVVLVPFLFWVTDRSRPDRYNIIAAVLLVAGIGCLSLEGEGFSIRFGDYMTLVGALFYALHIVSVAHFSHGRDIFVLTVFQFLMCAVCALVVSFLSETPPAISVFTPQLVGVLAYLSLACTTLGLLFQNVAQQHLNPTTAAILLSLESVFGVVFSMVFYHEVLTLMLTAGFALIFVAVIVSETKLTFLRRPSGTVRTERL